MSNKSLKVILSLVLIIVVLIGCGTQKPDSQGLNTAQPTNVDRAQATDDPLKTEGQNNTASVAPTPSASSDPKATPTPAPGSTNPPDESPSPSAEPTTTAAPVKLTEDKPLAGRIICVDPGHQSVTKTQDVPVAPGAKTLMPDFAIGTRGVSSGVFEYTVVLDVSKKLRDALQNLGAKVVLTREDADSLVSNIQRAQIANDANADIFVRIHCDGSESAEVHGISVLYPGDKYLSDKDMLDKSLALSKSILAGAVKETQAKDRGLYERSDLIGFNYSKVPCTLIEMGFMTNPDEDKLLNTASYQDKLVLGIVSGITDYFKGE